MRSVTGAAFILLFVAILVAPYGCSHNPFSGGREGKIIYDVTFEGENIKPMWKAMLPSEVVTYFGGGKTCMVISMGMNMMETKMISNSTDFVYTTIVSAMGKKMAMVLNKDQVNENYADRVKLKIVETDEVKEIAGVECKKAMVTDSTNNTYPVYYTNDLGVKEPNWSSPFRDIKGMLMEYSVNIAGMRMSLKAKEIVDEKYDPSFYEIPEGYEIIHDPKQMKFGMR